MWQRSQAEGVAAQPPREVSRSSMGSRLPTVYMVSSTSSKGDRLGDAGQGHLGGDEGVGHTGGVPVLAGVLHQPAHRVADQAQHVHQNGGGGVETLLGLAPPISSTAAATPTSA